MNSADVVFMPFLRVRKSELWWSTRHLNCVAGYRTCFVTCKCVSQAVGCHLAEQVYSITINIPLKAMFRHVDAAGAFYSLSC